MAFNLFQSKASSKFTARWCSNEVLLDLTLYCLQDEKLTISYLDQERGGHTPVLRINVTKTFRSGHVFYNCYFDFNRKDFREKEFCCRHASISMTKITEFTLGEFNRSINYQSWAQREEEMKGQNNKAIIILRLYGNNKWNFLSAASSEVQSFQKAPQLYEQREDV